MLLRRTRHPAIAFLTLAFLALLSPGARAGDAVPPSDGIVKELLKKAGMATDPAPAQDFVVKARPEAQEDYISVGRKEPERKFKAKTAAELKAMEAEFAGVQTRHDALRSQFPPAVKAMADQKAKEAQNGKGKKNAPPATSAQ
jgi:hypothetical protein